jgi:hypothetical protein
MELSSCPEARVMLCTCWLENTISTPIDYVSLYRNAWPDANQFQACDTRFFLVLVIVSCLNNTALNGLPVEN